MKLPMLGGIMGKTIGESTNEVIDQLQIYNIGKAGNDSNSGLNSAKDPILTIGQAITLATAQTPSSSNRFLFNIIDGGVYQLTEQTNLPSWCYIVGPGAILDAIATGNLVVADNSGALFGNVIRSGSGYAIHKTVGSGDAFVTILDNVDTGDFGFINLANGNLHVKFNRAVGTGATNDNLIQAINGSLYLDGNFLDNTGAAVSKTLRISNTAKLYANVDNINATDTWLELADTAEAYVKGKNVTGGLTVGGSTVYDIDIGATRVRSSGINVQVASGDISLNASAGKVAITGPVIGSKAILGLGDVNGFVVKYSSTTAVAITAGSIPANGIFYTLASDTTHTMTSLASGFDHHYIYIDHSASTSPTAVIIDSTTAPTFSVSKNAWYNGDDLMIGVVVSPPASATVGYFDTEVLSNNTIRNKTPMISFPQMATNMNPDGTWQTPDDNDGSVITPVNATLIFLRMNNSDVGSTGSFHAVSSEQSAVISNLGESSAYTIYSESARFETFVILGASRNVKIAAANNDDSFLSTWCTGFDYTR